MSGAGRVGGGRSQGRDVVKSSLAPSKAQEVLIFLRLCGSLSEALIFFFVKLLSLSALSLSRRTY